MRRSRRRRHAVDGGDGSDRVRAEMNIQAPPNLSPGLIGDLIAAGVNDWGGVSPVTPDHVNPEAPWPAIGRLRAQTASAGKSLTERLAIYPEYVREAPHWLDPSLQKAVLRAADTDGFARGKEWAPGLRASGTRDRELLHPVFSQPSIVTSRLDRIVQRASAGNRLDEGDIVACSRRAGVNSTPSASQPTLCAEPSAATPSATSSTATSTTPTSATTAAGSARFPRASSAIAARSGLRPRSRRDRAPRV